MADPQTSAGDPDVIKYSGFSGLRNDVDPERFDVSDLAAASNVDIDKSGRLSRRPGYTSVLAGAYHSMWSDDVTCLVVSGGALLKLSASYATTTLRTLADANSRMWYSKINDRIYFSNGTDTGVIENGVARTWGIAVPSLPAVTVTVGNLPAGSYQFSMTYLRNDGQESGAPLSGVITVPAGSGLNFTLPVSSDTGVVLKQVYISTPNGEVLYQALQVANSVTAVSYTNDALELTLPLITQFMGPPPAGQLVEYYKGRTFVAAGDGIYPSEEFAYELFDLRKYIPMDGRVTLLAPFEDQERLDTEANQSGFFVGTDKSCGTLTGSSSFVYVNRIDYGAIEGAVALVDGTLFTDGATKVGLLPMWLTTQGICVGMPQMEIRNLTRSRYTFSPSGKGAAIFVQGINKFIATSNF